MKKLFEGFLNPQDAAQAEKDILFGEQLFKENASPEPEKKVIADVKAEIAKTLYVKKTTAFRRVVYRTAAVAAVFLVVGAIGVKLFEQSNRKPVVQDVIAKEIWENDDAELTALAAEIEELKNSALAIEIDEYSANETMDISELEMNLGEVNAEFWEG